MVENRKVVFARGGENTDKLRIICNRDNARTKTTYDLFIDALNRPFLRVRRRGLYHDLLLGEMDYLKLKEVFEHG